jgi:hypothetical protein
VPSVYWKLGGNHRGAASVAFLEDFQKIVTGGGVERLQAPVIVCGRPLMASTF